MKVDARVIQDTRNVLLLMIMSFFKTRQRNELGEFELQKVVYLLQGSGIVPKLYSFNGYSRGPTSLSLREDLLRLEKMDLIRKRDGADGRYVLLKRNANLFLSEHKSLTSDIPKIKNFLSILADSTELELSLFAKLLEVSIITARNPESVKLFRE